MTGHKTLGGKKVSVIAATATFLLLAVLMALLIAVPTAGAVDVPDEQTKIEALKLGYILNGNSMVRWGSIDLTAPIEKPIRTIPINPNNKSDKSETTRKRNP